MTVAVAYEQILAGSSATVSVNFYDQYGQLADAQGSVTVAVTHYDGTSVTSGTATHAGTGIYTQALTASSIAKTDLLSAVWTDATAGVSKTTTIEVVGGYYFSLREIRDAYPDFFDDKADYPDAELITFRREVETECEKIAHTAFVPRFKTVTIWGEGRDVLQLPDRNVRSLRAVSFGNVALSASSLANTVVTADGEVQRYWPALTNGTDDSWGAWGQRFPYNTRVTLSYEHGYERPPADIKQAALERIKSRLTEPYLPLPANATSYTDSSGSGSFSFATTATGDDDDEWTTGIESIDRVYRRYRAREGDLASVPLGSVVRAGQWP